MISLNHSSPLAISLPAGGDSPKARAADGLISVATLLPALRASGETGRELAGALAGQPELAKPQGMLKPEDAGALHRWLSGKLDDRQFTAGIEQTMGKLELLIDKELKARGDEAKDPAFDISGMSTRMAALLAQAIVLMSALRTADSALSSKLSQVSFDATKSTAASMVREGLSNLSSSVAQGAIQFGVTGVGAKKQLSGLSAERGALKNNAPKLNKLGDEARNIQGALGRQGSVKLGADADSMKDIKLASPQAGNRQSLAEMNAQPGAGAGVADGMAAAREGAVPLQASNQRLASQHEAALGSVGDDIPVKTRAEQAALEDTRLKSQAKQTTGKAIMEASNAAGGIAGGSGRYAATLEQADQQISQASGRVASNASDEARERSRKADSIIQDLLKTLEGVSQSKSAAMGAIAGNIRA